ncbi:arsenate reductase ArsC [Dehalogenimonas sp. THU2]|uniref:arsenate reductase ArsC n=1 Tax=Dehalogenimonas sp. THU2 TaxID=3151121 RepID=UPI0032184589
MVLKKVLFVCIHNSGRSKMAEAFFNHYAHGEAVAESAGTEPGDSVNPVVVEAMKELGFDLSASLPRLLTFEMTQGIEKAITMGCMDNACPVIAAPKEDWALTDPKGKDLTTVRQIRDEIKQRVLDLIKALGITSVSD